MNHAPRQPPEPAQKSASDKFGWPQAEGPETATDRAVRAVQRDRRARERDERADERDDKATERDDKATDREAAGDLEGALADRETAEADRRAAESDRHHADVDRIHATRDHDASLSDQPTVENFDASRVLQAAELAGLAWCSACSDRRPFTADSTLTLTTSTNGRCVARGTCALCSAAMTRIVRGRTS